MNKSNIEFWKMSKIAAVFIVISVMTCFSINYTFPLHRDAAKSMGIINNTEKTVHTDGLVDRTKKMAANIENALKKLMDTPDGDSQSGAKCSHAKPGMVDNDLSNFEQLVIMKKYPYLDLKELDNYHPLPHKSVRQSVHSGPLEQESGFCESSVFDGPNVDITNRGLTGFAIPAKLVKNDVKKIDSDPISQKASLSKPIRTLLLEDLEQDILNYEKEIQ